MIYKYTDELLYQKAIDLTESSKINPFLLKNFGNAVSDAINFLNSNDKFLYIHGFLGVGKRQFVNYICDTLNKDTIKLEYFCKESTVTDDILLNFIEQIKKLSISKIININPKIMSLSVKFMRYISSIKKPFIIILHTVDNISKENLLILINNLSEFMAEENVKIVVTTKGIVQDLITNVEECTNITLKAFSQEIFSEFLKSNSINIQNNVLEDLYNYTRGYYFYTVLSIKIMQAMNITPNEFVQKIKNAEITFDSFIGMTYINLIPKTIGNFFWFLKIIRHGISLNALAVLGIYDEFSIEYLKSNAVIFIADEIIYLQDYFIQELEFSIPKKIKIKLHKYIINIYEEQLKIPIKDRLIMISRQAFRNEIDYHNSCINLIKNNVKEFDSTNDKNVVNNYVNNEDQTQFNPSYFDKIETAKKFILEKKYTDAIEIYQKLIDSNTLDLAKLTDVRLELARLYYTIGEYIISARYYDLVETYQAHKNENINLMYLYYEMAELYYNMYKNDRAINTIKKVIYSTNSPKDLIVKSCLLLGNIYSNLKQDEDAYNYYKKGIESSDSEIENSVLSELYFKYALVNDDKQNLNIAYEYYNKCLCISNDNNFIAETYFNLASCYYESENYDDALACFEMSYKIEKNNNNYEGIYHTSLKLAELNSEKFPKQALKYLLEAKQSAEFINEEFYMTNAYITLGDFYYNDIAFAKDALKEYFKAKYILVNTNDKENINKINNRIEDMRLRMSIEDFTEIENNYEKKS